MKDKKETLRVNVLIFFRRKEGLKILSYITLNAI